MKTKLKFVCDKDASSYDLQYAGRESFEYFFLITTRKLEHIDINKFQSLLNESTGYDWKYKELCQDRFYIFTARIPIDPNIDGVHGKNKYEFILETDFVPHQSKYITEIKKEE